MLLPDSRPVPTAELPDLYDWPRPEWVRACIALSLDGSMVGPDGRSKSLSSTTDRHVMAATRLLADAYLVGAQTVRAERYSAVRARPEAQQRRAAAGQRPAATLVVISGSCRFDWTTAVFGQSDEPPIVLTTEASDPADRAAAIDAGCRVQVLGERRVDVGDAVRFLRSEGLTRIALEGGPRLLSEMVGADLVDEMDLTVSPRLVAGPHLTGMAGITLHERKLAHVIEEDGFLFTRYVRPDGA